MQMWKVSCGQPVVIAEPLNWEDTGKQWHKKEKTLLKNSTYNSLGSKLCDDHKVFVIKVCLHAFYVRTVASNLHSVNNSPF